MPIGHGHAVGRFDPGHCQAGAVAVVLAGPVGDQAAPHGLLAKVRDLGLPLLSVRRIEPEPEP